MRRIHSALFCLAVLAPAHAATTSSTTNPEPTKPAPAAQRPAGQYLVAARVTLEGEVLGAPSASVKPGENFSLVLGKEGERRVTLTGMTAPINERSLALDFTLELEEWGKLGVASRRVSQTVRLGSGERYVVESGKDAAGTVMRMEISVTRPAP
jgi:hypothetical protein